MSRSTGERTLMGVYGFLRWEHGLLAFGLLGTVFLAAEAQAQASYSYTGHQFELVRGAYTTNDKVVVSFSLPSPLAPGSTTDITGSVTSYSFSDGVQTLTQDNSALITGSITTDGSGAPLVWSLAAFETPLPDTVGDPLYGITLSRTDTHVVTESGIRDFPCLSVTAGVCLGFNPGDPTVGETGRFGPATAAPARPWAVNVNAVPVPALGGLALLMLAAALALFGLLALSRRTNDLRNIA